MPEGGDGVTEARKRGFALLSVLLALGFLGLIGVQLVAAARTETRLARMQFVRAGLEAEADGGVQIAIFHLLAPGKDNWRMDRAQIHALREPDGATLRLSVRPLTGRINPNLASEGMMQALLGACNVDPNVAHQITVAIIGWRTEDVANKAITSYRDANRPWGPMGHPFHTEADLGQVLGMTPQLLTCLRPHLSFTQVDQPDQTSDDPVVRDAVRRASAGGGQSGENPLGDGFSLQRAVVIDSVVSGPDGARVRRHAVITLSPGLRIAPYAIRTWSGD